jgi:hypothetical protein
MGFLKEPVTEGVRIGRVGKRSRVRHDFLRRLVYDTDYLSLICTGSARVSIANGNYGRIDWVGGSPAVT